MDEDKKENLEKIFTDEDTLPVMPESKIVSKDKFLTPQSVIIESVRINRFGKVALNIKGPSDELTGEITITNKSYNALIKKFGTKASDFKGKKVYIKSITFEGSPTANPGYMTEAYV